jgi:putative colanic acid biosynthesis acetyltransferase WcaB
MKNFYAYLFQDWQANQVNTKGKIFSFFFRAANLSGDDSFARYLFVPARIIYKVLFEWFFGIEIPYNAKIGKGLKVYHLPGIVIHRQVIIGENCTLRQSTTIGNKANDGPCPVLGNHVNIGAHVCIIGDITIGDHVTIGAGSVVVKSVPSNAMVAGNPARVIRYLSPADDLSAIENPSYSTLKTY